jgi:DNA processing protein
MLLNIHSVRDMQSLPQLSPEPKTVTLAGVGRLHVAGDVRLLERPGIAVVGSRRASHEGRALAAEVACELVRQGLVVISGLAAGIDAMAHQAAMHAGGRTIAVIGTSLDQAYPRHHEALQAQIAREHLVVSPFESGTPTARWHFPARNRVMARIGRAMVLVEAGDTSGTQHQVRECFAVGRPVLVHGALLGEGGPSWLRDGRCRGELVAWWSAAQLGAAVAPLLRTGTS